MLHSRLFRPVLAGLLALAPMPVLPAQAPAEPKPLADAPLADHQRRLLDLAFEAACRFPVAVHGKDRGRAQDRVAAAAFELDQPQLALSFAPRIQDWRRGSVYADYAYYCARHGDTRHVERYLTLAKKVIDTEERDDTAQRWRTDSIRAKIGRAYLQMGEVEKARAYASAVDETTAGAVDRAWSDAVAARMATLTREQVAVELDRLTAAFADLVLGEQYTSMVAVGLLHRRWFDDADVRARCAQLLLETFVKAPPDLRLEALANLAEDCVAHADRAGAEDVLRHMAELVDGHQWNPEDYFPQVGRIAELRGRAGDMDRARAELEAALAKYHELREQIGSMYRCECLRPLALAWAVLGDREHALALVALGLEEGMENPNARPRCDDLVDTCVALAKHRIEPTDELWTRLREICNGLNDPW